MIKKKEPCSEYNAYKQQLAIKAEIMLCLTKSQAGFKSNLAL